MPELRGVNNAGDLLFRKASKREQLFKALNMGKVKSPQWELQKNNYLGYNRMNPDIMAG
jgi:hypothetical protein